VGDHPFHSGVQVLPEPSSESPAAQNALLYAGVDRHALYGEFQPLVRRLIRQYGDDPDLRQDLAGEIYCRFSKLLDAFDPERGVPLKPYLVRSLTAAVYTYVRSRRRYERREMSLEDFVETAEPGDGDPSAGWDQRLLTNEVLNTLPDAIAKLPKRQRQVVIWRYYDSRTFEEMAEILQVRPATVRSLLRHGLNNLRRRITAPEGYSD